jgi:hypothetical protein
VEDAEPLGSQHVLRNVAIEFAAAFEEPLVQGEFQLVPSSSVGFAMS